MARIIEKAAEIKGYTVLIASADEDASRFNKLADTFLVRQVDGLILAAPPGSERKLRELRKRKIPIVLIDRYFEGISLNNVILDNYQASFNGVSFLAGKGYRKIGMITLSSPLAHLKDRFEGYKAGLKSNKLRYIAHNTAHISDHSSAGEMRSVLQEMCKGKDRPDALLLATNNIAVSTMQAVKQLKIRIPERLALVCFDETDLAELFYAPITYIKQPLQQMGEWAVETLAAEINDGKRKAHVQFNEMIVERAST